MNSSISLITHQELPILLIKHHTGCAAISLQGSQLLFWHPTHTATPVIWLSEQTPFKTGTPIRGGVPICWPHFANFGEPLHGFARLLEWAVIDFIEHDTGVELSLQLTNSADSSRYTNAFFCLTNHIKLGRNCSIELTMEADDLEVTSALHSYFNISDINHIKVSGLGEPYQDRLNTINLPIKIGEMTFNQAVDRIYTAPDTINFIHDKDRIIQIHQKNATDVVVWNPAAEKCRMMPDMSTEGFKTMVCVETGRIMQPISCFLGQTTTLGFTIEVIQ